MSNPPVDPTVEHAEVERAAEQHSHPTYRFYALIGLILTVITGAEVAIVYIEVLDPVLVPLLMILSTAKFVLVVMFYMHLKQDSRIFSGVFLAPMALAVFLVVALIVLFKLLPSGWMFS